MAGDVIVGLSVRSHRAVLLVEREHQQSFLLWLGATANRAPSHGGTPCIPTAGNPISDQSCQP